MAGKKKEKEEEKDKEDLADEKVSSAEADEEKDGRDDADDAQKEDSGAKEKGARPSKSFVRRWWIPGLLIIVLIAAGTAVYIQPDLLKTITGKKKSLGPVDLTNDNLQEDVLSPFFIPPSADSKRGAIRVDLTIIWDGVASVRYKANELRVRAEIYDYLTGLDEEYADLDSLKTVMEEGMSGIFREALGAKDLAVRIKELKVI